MSFYSKLPRVAVYVSTLTLIFTAVLFGQTSASQEDVAVISKGSNAAPKAADHLDIADYEKLIAAAPSDTTLMNNLGALYYANSRIQEGLGYMKKAADAAPGTWNFQLNTSIAFGK